MNAQEYDELAGRTMTEMDNPIVFACLGIAGEAGELVDMIKKTIYHNRAITPEEVLDEVGDVLWYLTTLCRQYGVNLEDAMEYNIKKLAKRYPGKYTHEDSLARVDYADDFKSSIKELTKHYPKSSHGDSLA